MIKMYIGLHVKYRLLLADCNEIGIFSINFQVIFEYQISWKSVQLGAEFVSYGADGRIDMFEANSSFSQI